jgi:hypothetical protein
LVHPGAAYASVVNSSLTVRPARVEDVTQMARVHVRCWQETFRGLMSDAVLDDPELPPARERLWTVYAADHGTGAGRALLQAVTSTGAAKHGNYDADHYPLAVSY